MDVRGTKAWMAARLIMSCRHVVLSHVKADPVVRAALFEEQAEVLNHDRSKGKKAPKPSTSHDAGADIRELGRSLGVDFGANR